MDQETADRIEDTVARIKSIEERSEVLYLALGGIFPKLGSEAARSSREARAAIGQVEAIGSEGAARGKGRELADFLDATHAFIESLAARDAEFVRSVDEGVERLSGLGAIIQRVRSDSEEMELISLNAMTVALKSGAAGRAFSIITEELRRLSGQTIQGTVDIEYKGSTLLDSFRQLKLILERMSKARDEFFGGVRVTLGEGFERLRADIAEAVRVFGGLAEKAERVREPVLGIMQSVQWQDIIRQSLDHVVLALGEAARERSSSSGDAFAAMTLKLSTELMSDVEVKVASSAAALERDLELLIGVVESLEAERQAFVARFAASTGPQARLDDASYLAGKDKALSYAQSLGERVETLSVEFKRLDTLLSRFKNIVIASRIQAARSAGLLRKSNTVFAMERLTERIERDIGEANLLTRTFIKSSSAVIDAYASKRDDADRALDAELALIREAFAGLRSAGERAHEAIESLRLYTGDFLNAVAESRARLGELRGIEQEIRAIGRDLDRLQRLAAASSGELGIGEVKNERLKAMIERFTIYTHKEVAGRIGNIELDGASETGAVTLF